MFFHQLSHVGKILKHCFSSCFSVKLSATFHLCLKLIIIDVFDEKTRKKALLNNVSKEQDIGIPSEAGPGPTSKEVV